MQEQGILRTTIERKSWKVTQTFMQALKLQRSLKHTKWADRIEKKVRKSPTLV